jgi:predicted O-methyltransferase YrrM
MLVDLIRDIKRAQNWCRANAFPSNRAVRELRAAQYFDHMGQLLPNVHRSSDELCDIIAGCIVTLKLKRSLEIGTLFGYSTLHMAEAASQVAGRVVTVDLRVPERKWQNGEVVRDIHLSAEKNIRAAGFGKVVSFVAGRSEQILSKFVMEGEHFDLIFIDGSHSRYVVTLDLLNALNLISPGGLVFLDDVSEGIALKDFHYGGPNSLIPSLIGGGRFDMLLLSSNTMVLRPKSPS